MSAARGPQGGIRVAANRLPAQRDERASRVRTLVVFRIDAQRCALELQGVERVLPMVLVSPLPGAPDVVAGVVSLHGLLLPVLDLGGRFGLAPRAWDPSGRLLVARAPRRLVAVAVDEVLGVEPVDVGAVAPPPLQGPSGSPLEGIWTLPDGLVFIFDLASLLGLDEEQTLDAALEAVEP